MLCLHCPSPSRVSPASQLRARSPSTDGAPSNVSAITCRQPADAPGALAALEGLDTSGASQMSGSGTGSVNIACADSSPPRQIRAG
mmetsp:Transcript_14159/g.36344  ORF Transcript_14159/g.36344 Transcript_14159/m.36344 type:complete len:86 (+) Transcript_14159:17-274(+)